MPTAAVLGTDHEGQELHLKPCQLPEPDKPCPVLDMANATKRGEAALALRRLKSWACNGDVTVRLSLTPVTAMI